MCQPCPIKLKELFKKNEWFLVCVCQYMGIACECVGGETEGETSSKPLPAV